MALPATLSSDEVKKLPDVLQKEYILDETSNEYFLDTDVREHPRAKGLKHALDNEKALKSTLESKLKEFDGIDPKKVKDYQRQAEMAQREKDLTEGNFQKALNDALEEKDGTINKLINTNRQLEQSIDKLLITETATRSIVEQDGFPEVLIPHIQQVTIRKDDKVMIMGQDGKPLLKKNYQSMDDTMTLDEYIVSLKTHPVWSVAFKPINAGGSGENTTSRTRGPSANISPKNDGTLLFQ